MAIPLRVGALCAAPAEVPLTVSATFSETMITLRWQELADVKAYNVYARYNDTAFVCANPVPITSRPQYSFIWVGRGEEKRKVVKGSTVSLYVTALTGEGCGYAAGPCTEAGRSNALTTEYFKGFSRVRSAADVTKALTNGSRKTPALLDSAGSIPRRTFTKVFPALSRRLDSLYRKQINPRDEGACVPFSTLAAKYLSAKGIACYRCQGNFIKEFHSFNLVIIDSTEYILDFTADQFLPSSSPVLIPRASCFIDSLGRPTSDTSGTVTPMYIVDKVFHPDQLSFSESEEARFYREALETLFKK
jgi:hypothetical protein